MKNGIYVQMESPLEWPAHVPRTEDRKAALFFRKGNQNEYGFSRRQSRTPAEARDYVWEELERLGADMVVISTNFDINKDEFSFRANQREPRDPGVAVFFDLDGNRQLIAIDAYQRAADNLWAVGRTVAAFRQIERDGGPQIMRTAVSGFKLLPENTSGVNWWDVLELGRDAGAEDVRAAYKRLAMQRHPDRGGSNDEFVELQDAMRQGLAAREGRVS